jgi:hypothetical protein
MPEQETDVRETVYALEERRRAAVSSGDSEVLSMLLSDTFTQVHANGRVEDKAASLAAAASRRAAAPSGAPTATPVRPELVVYGDAAMMRGTTVHRATVEGEIREFNLFATQVAVREEGVWRFVHIQATMLPAT